MIDNGSAGRPALVSPLWAWLVAMGVVALSLIQFGGLERFFEWDEAVFWSQSGGYAGNEAPVLLMVASREWGPAALIGFFRNFGLGLVGVRIAWATITVVVLFLAAWRIERHLGRWVGVTTAVVFGTSWLFSAYAASFYGAGLASVFGLLILALYLDLSTLPPSTLRGVLLGLATVGALWMRTFETSVVLVVLLLHSLVVARREVWSIRIGGVGAALATVTALFVAPWSADSVSRFGGITERLDAASNQGYALSFDVRVGPYLEYLAGGQQANSAFASIPEWPGTVMTVIVSLVVLSSVLFLCRGASPSVPVWRLVATLTVATLSFYLFLAEQLRDRYLLFGLAFLFLAFAGLLVTWFSSPRRALYGSLAVVILAAWTLSQWAVAEPYQQARVVPGEQLASFGALLDDAVDEPCRGIARYGAAQWQIATGCSFRAASDPEVAQQLALDLDTDGVTVIVVWPESLSDSMTFGDEWQTVQMMRTDTRADLVFVGGERLTSAEIDALEEDLSREP